jgi:glyoxylase-like metal-dependent hydrolase (beta-lactamase superfamily II)
MLSNPFFMNLHVIDTGFFKLDGGAMFGVVPKIIWQKTNPADENNMCTWAMRCLLIEDGNRLILIDNGIGTKQDAKFLSYYYLHGEADLLSSIRKAGFSPDDITDMVLTHLHFDHCGGGVQYNASRSGFELTFKNAHYWSNSSHWQWATHPNAREKASFLKENLRPMQESGHLQFIEPGHASPFPTIDFIFVDGHTEKMILPRIRYQNQTIVFIADLIPSSSHIPIPYVMGYDTRPLLTMEEKTQFLDQAAQENYLLFFEHDPYHECASVIQTEKGVRVQEKGKLKEMVH